MTPNPSPNVGSLLSQKTGQNLGQNLRLIIGNDEHVLCRRQESAGADDTGAKSAAGAGFMVLSPAVAERVIEQAALLGRSNWQARRFLTGGLALVERTGSRSTSRSSPGRPWAALTEAVRTGLVVVRRRPLPLQHLPQTASEDLPPPSPETAERTDWIEVQVSDEEGAPYNGPYKILLPNGTLFEGTLVNGRARHEGIKPGTCKVSFPELDAGAWRKA
jgi:hypothetical protein